MPDDFILQLFAAAPAGVGLKICAGCYIRDRRLKQVKSRVPKPVIVFP